MSTKFIINVWWQNFLYWFFNTKLVKKTIFGAFVLWFSGKDDLEHRQQRFIDNIIKRDGVAGVLSSLVACLSFYAILNSPIGEEKYKPGFRSNTGLLERKIDKIIKHIKKYDAFNTHELYGRKFVYRNGIFQEKK